MKNLISRASVLAAAVLTAGAYAGVPVNDDCVDAILIGDETVNGTTDGASNDGTATCGASASAPDVWYRYVAPMDGLFTATTCGSDNYDTVLSIWTGCPGSGSQVNCNDDSCGLRSTVSWSVTEGEDYYVRVSGYNGAFGTFSLEAGTTKGGGGGEGPDVVYSDCTSINNFGVVGGIRGYALGSNTCNIGDTNLAWGGNTPLLAMNAYKLANGRLTQIGMSFVKNGTGAGAGSGCGLPCNGQGGSVLGAGCLDVYGAGFNGGQSILGPRSTVNAFTGEYPGASGGSGNVIYKRLQIAEADLSGAGAIYFLEGQYVAWDDAAAGNDLNNASYKRMTLGSGFNLSPAGSMEIGVPAIHAWRDHGNGVGVPDETVEIVEVDVPEEGRFHVASKVTQLEGGLWHYEYAVRNLNSHRSAATFAIALGSGVNVTGVGFSDVEYHSGEPYDGTDWLNTVGATNVRWASPQNFNENPYANALRFGTMYNFWFDADSAPVKGEGSIRLFRPGTPSAVDLVIDVPGGGVACPADFDGDGEVTAQDLVEMILNWGPCPGCPADLDGDGDVTSQDLVQLILLWGPC